MVMTILEAHVTKENWEELEQAYNEGRKHDEPGLVQSFLIQSRRKDELWRILTLWSSREALEAMRSSNETPRGVQMFRQAHAEPMLTIYDVVQQIEAKTQR